MRGRDVFVIQSLHGGPAESANDKLIRLLFFIGALKDAGATRVTAVTTLSLLCAQGSPYQAERSGDDTLCASLFEAVGTDAVVTLEVHNPAAFENAFRRPVVALTATPLFVAYAKALAGDNLCVVSPDTGGVKRAELFRETLEAEIGKPVGKGFAEKHRSGGVVSGELFVGDVKGATALVIDDLITPAARCCEQPRRRARPARRKSSRW